MAAVARVMLPKGAKFDYMTVLYSAQQGLGKSTFFPAYGHGLVYGLDQKL
ncbi:VapE domain-containing protein [Paenibacillus melissococcoides]